MIQSSVASCKYTQNSKYESCIKINGVSILPPLITPEKRKELLRLKREAIKVEQRLQREKELKQYVAELYEKSTANLDVTNAFSSSRECQTTHVLDHLALSNKVSLVDIKSKTLCSNLENTAKVSKNLAVNVGKENLLVDVYPKLYQNCDNIEPLASLEQSDDLELQDSPSNTDQTPRLIRRNSYVLDTPSPALIEYLRTSQTAHTCSASWDLKKDASCLLDNSITNGECDGYTEVMHECCKCKHQNIYSDISNTLTNKNIPQQNSETLNEDNLEITLIHTSSIPSELGSPLMEGNIGKDAYAHDSSNTETELRHLSDSESQLQDFIMNNVSTNNAKYDFNSVSETQLSSKSESVQSDPTLNWDSVLNKIPSLYSRQILKLLELQQLNQLHYSSEDAFDKIQLHPEKYSTPVGTADTSHHGDTMYYSMDNNTDLQHETRIAVGDNGVSHDASSTLFKSVNSHVPHETISHHVEETALQLQKLLQLELTNWKKHEEAHIQKQNGVATLHKSKGVLTCEQAATIISAAVRGYLVRRLMKTEKVQLLIQTIKEAVLCAMQLHCDNLEYIEQADVDLHRRLIQQVSAACNSFHTVFFATSVQDQMSFIGVDRQKRIDRMRRISSANSIASTKSTNSTSRSKLREE